MSTDNSNYEFTVCIPVYNEQEALPVLCQKLADYIKKASVRTAVLFVNDGSTDNSADLIKQYCVRHEDFYYISLERRCGLTAAVKAAVDAANSPWLGYMAADMQTEIEDFELLLQKRYMGSLIVGYSDLSHKNILQRVWLKFVLKWLSFITSNNSCYYECPLKIVKVSTIKELPLILNINYYLASLVKLSGHRVHYVPVRYTKGKRRGSRNHLGDKLRHGVIDLLALFWFKHHYVDPAILETNYIRKK